MPDSISTPSQAHSTVSNDAFEALIDLLAFDGMDENPSNHPGNRANVSLRDPSGKLDFNKIRLMFASQNVPEVLEEEKKRVRIAQSPTLPNNEGDSDDEPHSHQSTSSSTSSRSNSMSPKPVGHAPTGHRRSSTFGNQPWASIHGNATQAKVVDVPPTLLRQPLSFNELNTALAGAHEEVRSLRQQYDELQALVSNRLGTDIRDQTKIPQSAVNTDEVNGCVDARDTGSQAQSNTAVPLTPVPSDVPIEIVSLSENEAKQALSVLARSLNLSLSAISQMAILSTPGPSTLPQQCLSPSSPTRQHDVASIARALKFLGTVDELVWRRTSASSGPRTLLPVFSEENIVALLARLELWERAVRRPSRV